MSIPLVLCALICGIVIGHKLFGKWFNHLSLYSFIMGGLIFLYELKLLPYHDIIPLAWFYIVSSSLSLFIGSATILAARTLSQKQCQIAESNIDLIIFKDKGKALKYSVIFFSLISLFVAIHRWYILIGMFGSIENVFINAAVVYRLNVEGEIKEFIPILPSFVYVAIFFSAIYTAYKGKFSILSFLPFIGIILKELTVFGRGELLFTLFEFVITFFLFRHLLNSDIKKRFRFSKPNAYIAVTILFALVIIIASVVKESRGGSDKFVGKSSTLKQLDGNFFISPGLYFYLSADIGVFSRYVELEKENVNWGENTFKGFYFLLNKLGVAEKPAVYQKAYFIPMWINTGTYLREIHADFGPIGIWIVPYLIGFSITWLWFKFYEEKSLFVLSFLVYLLIIIGFSFLAMVTRLNQWYFSQVFILIYIPLLERFSSINVSDD